MNAIVVVVGLLFACAALQEERTGCRFPQDVFLRHIDGKWVVVARQTTWIS